jgi:hypothetical protein
MNPTVLGLFLVLVPHLIMACSVPVFRYALEQWPAAPYNLVVSCQGNLDDHQQALLARLSGTGVPRPSFANLIVHLTDSRTNAPVDLLGAATNLPPAELAHIELRYPEEAVPQCVIWSGRLSESTIDPLLDSPMRRRIVQHLVRGDSAVWVLLETGDPEQDNAAAGVLQTRLEHCQRTLTFPKQDIEGDNTRGGDVSSPAVLE